MRRNSSSSISGSSLAVSASMVSRPGFVAFVAAHLVELAVVGQLGRQLLQRQHHGVEDFFLAQFLGLLRVVPAGRVFQRGVYRAQAFVFGIVVKDTSSSAVRALRSSRCCQSG